MFSSVTKIAAGDTGDFTIPEPPVIDTGGPYVSDGRVQLNVIITPNSGENITLTWSSNKPGIFSDIHAEDPFFTPGDLGTYILTVTLTTSNTNVVEDTATLTSNHIFTAVYFDGVSDYMEGGVSSPNSKEFTLSFWVNRDSFTDNINTPSIFRLSNNTGQGNVFWVYVFDTTLNVAAITATGLGAYSMTMPLTGVFDWNHVLIAANLGTGDRVAYLNGQPAGESYATFFNSPIQFANANHNRFAALQDITNNPVALFGKSSIADFYFNIGTYQPDITKFINGAGPGAVPVNLGSSGEFPTGAAPAIYFTGNAATWNAGINAGSSGNWLMHGSVTQSPYLPVTVPS